MQIGDPIAGEPPAGSGALAAVAMAWPVIVIEPDAAAAYEKALFGLDLELVRDVVASLARAGRPAPSPGLLRTVVLSRRAAATNSGVTSDRPRAAPPPPVTFRPPRPPEPSAEIARRALVPMIVSGVAALLALGGTRQSWVTLGFAGRRWSWDGADVPGGGLVEIAAVVALVVLVIGAFYVRYRRGSRHFRAVFAALALVGAASVIGCARGFMAVGDAKDDFMAGVRAGFGAQPPPGTERLVAIWADPGLWASLAFSLIAAAAAVYGFMAVRSR